MSSAVAAEGGGTERRGTGPATQSGLQDLTDMGVYVVNAQGRIVEVNDRAVFLLGRSAEALLGQDAHDLLHRGSNGSPLTRSHCPMLKTFLGGGTAQGGPVWHARGDGSLLATSWLVTPCDVAPGERGAAMLFREMITSETDTEPARRRTTLSELDRLSLLAETTPQLSATLDVEDYLRRLARLVVPRLADWAVVDLLDEDGGVRRAAVAHHDGHALVTREDLQGPLPPVPPDSPEGLARALRGAAATVTGPEDYRGEPASGLEGVQQELLRATGMHSVAIAPLRGVRRVLGALTLGHSERPEVFDELALLQDIAFRAGLALENARQFQGQREVAETMQRHLLPHLPDLPRFEMAARYLPATETAQVGGDWYDAFTLPDGAMAVAIGDVVGHDLEAAAAMSQVRNLLRAYAWSRREPPSEIVALLDEAVENLTDAAMASLIIARLEGGEDGGLQLRWANAGHPPPLLVTREGEAHFLGDVADPVLCTGVRQARSDFIHLLPSGAVLLFYTDGLVESPSMSVDDGLGRLRANAAALAHRPLDDFCNLLLRRVVPHDCDDDVALLVLRTPGRRRSGPGTVSVSGT